MARIGTTHHSLVCIIDTIPAGFDGFNEAQWFLLGGLLHLVQLGTLINVLNKFIKKYK